MVSPALSGAPYPSSAFAVRATEVRDWHLPARVVLPVALLVALLLSTQFLFQPFVWRNWPVDEVMLGWLDIMRARATTALAIGVALVLVSRMQVGHPGARAALLAGAIALGAGVGELAPLVADERAAAHELHLALGRVLQWTVVGCSSVVMVHLWRRSADARAAVQAAELRASQTERQLAQVRLQALRSRIEPHFLFNTLANVRRLRHVDPTQGAGLLADFLTYLRITLASESAQRTSLGQELDLVRAYLNIVATRMSGRLALRWDVPDELLACELPPLVIATLVENAVKHGIAPRPAGGSIEVRAQAVGATLEITVADDGVGFTGSGGSGIGLANTRARLATLYGAAGTLTLENNRPGGVRARIGLPRLSLAPS
jgi:signal transduction histidine kinase